MKILTDDEVIKNGWDKKSIITSHMIEKYGYTQIGDYAFFTCHNLTSITLPDNITSIEAYAFYGCNRLTSVTIGNRVTSIGKCAFGNCKRLASINIPNSVISIGDYAFHDCYGLTSIVISNNVTNIGCSAFRTGKLIIPLKKYDNLGRLIAYKGFCRDMTCLGFQYEEGKTFETNRAKLCECGFHACINPLDVFNYYYGKINENIVIHEVYLEGVSEDLSPFLYDSKVVAKKITIGKRLSIEDINKIIQ